MSVDSIPVMMVGMMMTKAICRCEIKFYLDKGNEWMTRSLIMQLLTICHTTLRIQKNTNLFVTQYLCLSACCCTPYMVICIMSMKYVYVFLLVCKYAYIYV